jgi:hypothetical protein
MPTCAGAASIHMAASARWGDIQKTLARPFPVTRSPAATMPPMAFSFLLSAAAVDGRFLSLQKKFSDVTRFTRDFFHVA